MGTHLFIYNEFYLPGTEVPREVLKKLNKHIEILFNIQKKIGESIYVSKHSGYRPVEYELAKGRSGNSEHCFKGDGAVDITCAKEAMPLLRKHLASSPYTRLCFYPENNFIHCDFKKSAFKFYVAP